VVRCIRLGGVGAKDAISHGRKARIVRGQRAITVKWLQPLGFVCVTVKHKDAGGPYAVAILRPVAAVASHHRDCEGSHTTAPAKGITKRIATIRRAGIGEAGTTWHFSGERVAVTVATHTARSFLGLPASAYDGTITLAGSQCQALNPNETIAPIIRGRAGWLERSVVAPPLWWNAGRAEITPPGQSAVGFLGF
jgi:hypothetical protein